MNQRQFTSTIPTFPTAQERVILEADNLWNGIGAIFSQTWDCEEIVFDYYRKMLGKAERNYCVTRKELLGGSSDHSALQWLMRFRNPKWQLTGWLKKLQTLDFKMQQRKGKIHANVDNLPRRISAKKHANSANPKKNSDMASNLIQKFTIPDKKETLDQDLLKGNISREPQFFPILPW